MIKQDSFTVEPWSLRETELDLDMLAQTESVFALSNGHVGWRGNLDEGEPHGLPGSYLNGVYALRPLPASERAYGRPESGQTVINVTNGKLIRLFVDDEPFDVRYGKLISHERVLDFRAGTLRREAEWESPVGGLVRVTSTRLVSFSHRAIAAVCYEVEPLQESRRISVQSEMLTNEQLPSSDGDPRSSAVLEHPLQSESTRATGLATILVHKTEHSGLRVGAAMDHLIDAPVPVTTDTRVWDDGGMMTASVVLEPGQRLQLIKFVAYAWSGVRSLEAIRDQAWAALSGVRQAGWQQLLADQRGYLDDFWGRADVEIQGDTEIQQAVRFALFHVLQAGARGEERPIPAKGLTGPGYDGHTFWDTEAYVLPVLTLTAPDAAVSALSWRHSTMPMALERAKQLGFAGAAFPWRTIAGKESSGYWPAGTAALHINADIAEAVTRYLDATDDENFASGQGMDLLVQTARLWRSVGHHDSSGQFHIDGVTGPDEYSAIADDNVYTNLLAKRNLANAAAAAKQYPDRAAELGVGSEEAASWRDAAEAMHIPFDDALGVHPQTADFTRHQVWDFAATPSENYPLMLHYPYLDLYRKQVVKQADLVMAMMTCADEFTTEQMARNFDFYEALTVRDSSLSACIQAVIAAEVGHLDLAYDYLGEAALLDLADLEHNTRDGVHIASLAGAWLALVMGFGGLRHERGNMRFAPRLPDGISRLAFMVIFRGRRLQVEISHHEARYLLVDGEPLEIIHHGERLTLSAGHRRARPVPALQPGPRPSQPAGRAPIHRRTSAQLRQRSASASRPPASGSDGGPG
jgi:alpha,alpha-trehalose phosphorylase